MDVMKSFRSVLKEVPQLKTVILNFSEETIANPPDVSIKNIKDEELIFVLDEVHKQNFDSIVIAAEADKAKNIYKLVEYFNSKLGIFKSIDKIELNQADKEIPEELREEYKAGNILNLKEDVKDLHTGLIGKIVYRGPTYVTLEINEDLSFKRWISDVETIIKEEPKMEARRIPTFANYVTEAYPADVKKAHMDRLHFCVMAQKEFDRLLDDESKDQQLVLVALDKTAHYLDIEEYALDNPDEIDDHMVSSFVSHMRDAAQALEELDDLENHEAYMEKHAHAMMNAIHGDSEDPKEESYQFEQTTNKVLTPNELHLNDDDLKEIEKHIDQLEWEDIKHIYDKQEPQEMEESIDLDEDLTAAQRMKKKMEFLKTRAKREIAKKIAMKRVGSQGRLKKRAILHARQLIMKRILRGRDKSRLSAAEKNRIEEIVRKAKPAVMRISNRLLPKLRQLELKRLKHVKEQQIIDVATQERTAVRPTSNAEDQLAWTKAHLSGDTTTIGNPEAPDFNYAKNTQKRKQYRKMEV